ncbi:uncharacterized protein I206_107535 [Kwoniella pini CBS 10737]|uniref:SCP domain-containing protein n=1 Tax=Kwoniella pini CBS 10737 TaxID=1296096 RepID=A0A1B9HXK3_9TREE|nr:uncharacterized protein I206_05863 [Kwoniella pini CBS 10737]OCF47997.1 hypothetical protein I206_05863 [Kwoniella pini CBS 10737]
MLTSATVFISLISLVSARPHCNAHNNANAATVTYLYTRHHAMSTAIGITSAATSLAAIPTAGEKITTSITEQSSSIIESTVTEVTSTPNVIGSSGIVSTQIESVIPNTSTSASLVVPTNLAASQTNSSSGSTSGADAELLVKLHNDFRAQYGAGPITWSDTLANYAKSHATACNMKHTNGPYGENLAAGAGGGYSITDGFDSWANEASQYDPSNPQYSHFTQVVWKATTEIGCAAVSCADGTIFDIGTESLYIMCEYNPPGNVIGQFGENVGSKSS